MTKKAGRKYKIVRWGLTIEDTEKNLNSLAEYGWKVVGTYSYLNTYIIMEKEE